MGGGGFRLREGRLQESRQDQDGEQKRARTYPSLSREYFPLHPSSTIIRSIQGEVSMRFVHISFFVLGSFLLSCSPAETETSAVESSNAPPVEGSLSAESTARGEAVATIGTVEISIDYGRPAMGGEDRTASLEPGFVWRLGKNEATTLTTSGELVFGDVVVPAGSYSLFAEKGTEEGAWILLVNSETGLWGSFDHDPEKNIARIPLVKSVVEESTDLLLIEIEKTDDETGALLIKWGSQQLRTSFTT